jgi:putative membrane protein
VSDPDPQYVPSAGPADGGAAAPAPGPAPSPGAKPDVRSPLSDGEWHRLHPLTPLLRGGLFVLVIVGIVVANLRERLLELFLPALAPDVSYGDVSSDPIDFVLRNGLLPLAALAVLGALVVLLVLFWLSWRAHTFRISDDDVEVRSGVLFRTHRRAPLDRVQGVNLTRPMLARLFGMAKLEVVGAGTDANVNLEYLSTVNAETVRADILRLASGRRLARAAGAGRGPAGGRASQVAGLVSDGITGIIAGEDLDADEPESVVQIPAGRLIASRLVSLSTLGLIAAVAAVIVAAVIGTTWLLFTLVPVVLGFGGYALRGIVRSLRYSIAPTSSGVRVTFGLFTTISETLPPGRIHAVEVRQSFLWRPFGWWSITVNRLSGRSATDTSSQQFTAILPVGTRADVERVLRLLLPALPEEEWPLVFTHGTLGPVEGDPYTTTPRRARLLHPLSWRRNGAFLTPDALFLRRGVIWRTLAVFPLARMQSIRVTQGPLSRALGTAGLSAAVVAGSVTTSIEVLDRDEALRIFEGTASGIVAASAGDRSHRWAS